MMNGPPQALVTVRIVALPLDVYQRASEHSDELLREFALVREENSEHVPSRLLGLIDELNARFASFTQRPTAALHDALERGDSTIDLTYEVPPEVGEGADRLGALLDETDDFCRSGELLTLATGPESLAFRRWFLDEFVRQIGGAPPRPWSPVIEEAYRG